MHSYSLSHMRKLGKRGHVLPKVTKKSVKSWLVLGLPPVPAVSPLNSTGKVEAEAVVKVFIPEHLTQNKSLPSKCKMWQ